MSNLSKKTILVVKNRAMGDGVISLSACQYLKQLAPDAEIILGVPSWFSPLFNQVQTVCSKFIGIDLSGISGWLKLWRDLKENNVDIVFELFQSGRTAKFFEIYSFFNKCEYFYHNHHLNSHQSIHDHGVIKANIQRDLDGIYTYWGDKIPDHLEYRPQMTVEGEDKNDRLVTLGVVATRETKMWPIENYITLARMLKENKFKVQVPVAKTKTDQLIKEKIINLGGNKYIDFLEVSLSDLPREISKSSFYIGNDTGIKHISVALGLKTLTLFGPEPPLEWHPYNEKYHKFLYKDGLECRTLKAHFCGLSTCESMICLNQFSPEQVYAKFQSLVS